ncbi:phosphonate ABC transporter substrate-binding protein [Hyphomicrobiales bacterium]|nr:phosphonate ABC transporter substrate-binding protein [Hyphomicrobiales bacterium]MDB9925767.1 phosphonate ABC transporter substrate-binding protein [Hyphomicrobiales bacterium]
MFFRNSLISLILFSFFILVPSLAFSEWREEVKELKIGLAGGENEADRLKNYECWRSYLEENLEIPVKFYPASDVAGIIHGLLGKTLDYASVGPSAYAAMYIDDPDAVEPIITIKETDGSNGYKSAMYVRKDSNIYSIEDMRGKSIAWSDPNTTSGYLVPSFELHQRGLVPSEFFSRTGFAGGHEQAIIAVLNGQYDAGATWVSGQGAVEEGYTRGVFRNMIKKGLLDMDKLRVIWLSKFIMNGPHVIRKDLPVEFKEELIKHNLDLQEKDEQCFKEITFGESQGFIKVSHKNYENIVEIRNFIRKQRRR